MARCDGCGRGRSLKRCKPCEVTLCGVCLAGTERCPSCQTRFDDDTFEPVLVSESNAADTRPPTSGAAEAKGGRKWTIAGVIVAATVGLKIIHALLPRPEPVDMEEFRQTMARYRDQTAARDASEDERVRSLEQQADARRRLALAVPCDGAPSLETVRSAPGDTLADAMRRELTEVGAFVQFVDEPPFETPFGSAEAPLRMTVLRWSEPSETSHGTARALVELAGTQADTPRCRGLVEVVGDPVAEDSSLDAARFSLLWTALQRGTAQLHPVADEADSP